MYMTKSRYTQIIDDENITISLYAQSHKYKPAYCEIEFMKIGAYRMRVYGVLNKSFTYDGSTSLHGSNGLVANLQVSNRFRWSY